MVSVSEDFVSDGPRDFSELPPTDAGARLDLGGMLLTPIQGVEVQVQADEASGAITQVTCTAAGGAMQVHAYAAPRSGGMWEDIRGQIRSSINSGGGLVEDVEGPFGIELRAQVRPTEGGANLQPARFVGIDGPRWFLRAVFLGAAARPGESSETLETMLRGIVVRRGGDAMPVGAPIPLRIPDSARPVGEESRPRITLPERGPEITEVR